MITLYYPEDFSAEKARTAIGSRGCAIALGFFDGVHLAHRELISRAQALARERNLLSAVFTFPSENEGIKSGAKRIYSTEQKLSILEELGVDICFVVRFSAVASLSPEEFITDILIGAFGAEEVVCGYNFRFGRGASGDADYLCRGLGERGVGCTVIEDFKLNGVSLSSTYIRELLSAGDTESAARALGLPYFIEGEVTHGDGRGRGLGIPTANLPLSFGGEALRRGVYAAAVSIDGALYPALTNVGECPTFTAREPHSETYLLDYEGNLYGKRIRVYLLGFLRDERLFDSKEELIMQINVDKKHASELFTEAKWQELGLN